MKILFFSGLEAVPFGGSEQLWTDMALRFLKQKHTVMACVLAWPETPGKILQIQNNGGQVVFRPNIHLHGSKKDWIINQFKKSTWKKQIRQFQPDVIFINLSGTFEQAVFLNREWLQSLNVPYYVLSNVCEEYGLIDKIKRNYFKHFFKNAQKSFFVSQRNLEVAERMMLATLTNASVIKNPIKINTTPNHYPDTSIFNMAVVARLNVAVKGFDILIETFAKPEWEKRNFKINIYGTGDDELYIKELIEFRNLENKIIFHGFNNNVITIWEENHLLLMPSRMEGTPLTLLEASYCSRAAVVTDVGDNAAVIKEGENGFVAEAPVISSFSNAMERAWQRREEWESMGKTAKTMLSASHPEDPVATICNEIEEVK